MSEFKLIESLDTTGVLTGQNTDGDSYKKNESEPAVGLNNSDEQFSSLIVDDKNIDYTLLPDQNYRKQILLTYTQVNQDLTRQSPFLEYLLLESGLQTSDKNEWEYIPNDDVSTETLETTYDPNRPNSVTVIRKFLTAESNLTGFYQMQHSFPVQYKDVLYGKNNRLDGWYTGYAISVREYNKTRPPVIGDIVHWKEKFYKSLSGKNIEPDGRGLLGNVSAYNTLQPTDDVSSIGATFPWTSGAKTGFVGYIVIERQGLFDIAGEFKIGSILEDSNGNTYTLGNYSRTLQQDGTTYTMNLFLTEAGGVPEVGTPITTLENVESDWTTETKFEDWFAFMTTIQNDNVDVKGYYAETQFLISKDINDNIVRHLTRMYRAGRAGRAGFNTFEIEMWNKLTQARIASIAQFRSGNFTEALGIVDSVQTSTKDVSSYRGY